jgi:hypothetical protein
MSVGQPHNPAPQGDPGKPLTAVLPRAVVIGLALASFVVSLVVLGLVVALGLFWPQALANATGRFLLLLLISLNFAVFFFVFYPQDIAIDKFVLGARLAGPLAVLFIVLFALWKWMPDPFPTSYRMFVLKFENDAKVSNLTLAPSEPAEFHDYYVIRDPKGDVIGVLIRFPPDHLEPIKATVTVPGILNKVPVEFPRGVGEKTVEVKQKST